jgi:hypothetical protein
MQVVLKFRDDDARSIQYYLRRRYSSRKGLEKLILIAIRKEVGLEAQRELDEMNAQNNRREDKENA